MKILRFPKVEFTFLTHQLSALPKGLAEKRNVCTAWAVPLKIVTYVGEGRAPASVLYYVLQAVLLLPEG